MHGLTLTVVGCRPVTDRSPATMLRPSTLRPSLACNRHPAHHVSTNDYPNACRHCWYKRAICLSRRAVRRALHDDGCRRPRRVTPRRRDEKRLTNAAGRRGDVLSGETTAAFGAGVNRFASSVACQSLTVTDGFPRGALTLEPPVDASVTRSDLGGPRSYDGSEEMVENAPAEVTTPAVPPGFTLFLNGRRTRSTSSR